jgi:hypothetical protein
MKKALNFIFMMQDKTLFCVTIQVGRPYNRYYNEQAVTHTSFVNTTLYPPKRNHLLPTCKPTVASEQGNTTIYFKLYSPIFCLCKILSQWGYEIYNPT